MSMELDTQRGSEIFFTNSGGFPLDREKAAGKLECNVRYTVKRVFQGSFCSYVELDEVTGAWNTVMFKNIQPPEESP